MEVRRQRILGALATVLDPRLASWATTASQPPSFEAYQLFAEGIDLLSRGGPHGAVSRLRQAFALDTSFTAPLVWAIHRYQFAGEYGRADSLIRILEPVRDRLIPWDRAMFDYQVATVKDDRVGAYHAMKKVVEIAPASQWVFWLAAAAIYVDRPGEVVDLLTGLNPERGWLKGWPFYWNTLMYARHQLADYRGELEDVKRARQLWSRPYEGPELRALVGLEACGGGDAVGRRDLGASAGMCVVGLSLGPVDEELRVHGHRAAADQLLERILAVYEAPPRADLDNSIQSGNRGHMLLLAGRLDEARAVLERVAQERFQRTSRSGCTPMARGHLGLPRPVGCRGGEAGRPGRGVALVRADRSDARFRRVWGGPQPLARGHCRAPGRAGASRGVPKGRRQPGGVSVDGFAYRIHVGPPLRLPALRGISAAEGVGSPHLHPSPAVPPHTSPIPGGPHPHSTSGKRL